MWAKVVQWMGVMIGVVSSMLFSSNTAEDVPSIATPSAQLSPTPVPTNEPESGETQEPGTPTPNQAENVEEAGPESNLTYPRSQVISRRRSSLELTSTDNPETITDWYDTRIEELGYLARSTVRTTTNGEVDNRLKAAKNNERIAVRITKSADSNEVSIEVNW